MTGNFGRVRQLRLLMVTGNGNGTAGFSLTRSPVGRGSHTFQKAVNKAGLRLVNFDLYENRTVYHDFFTKFGQTTIFAQQRPQGQKLSLTVKGRGWC
jgi:small subunit ribosomal protein S5